VGGGDRRGVEAGDRAGEVVAVAHDVAACQQRHHGILILAGRGAGKPAAEATLDARQPLAHALAKLAGGDAGEGDEQQTLQRDALGDIARRQRRDRVGLARAGAGLENSDAGGQGAAGIELDRLQREGGAAGGALTDAHRARTSSRESNPSHSRRDSRPKREASDSGQPCPSSPSAGATSAI
jgi:hypothetical protein